MFQTNKLITSMITFLRELKVMTKKLFDQCNKCYDHYNHIFMREIIFFIFFDWHNKV